MGQYDLLVYGHGGPNVDEFNGIYTVDSAGRHYGPASTSWELSWHAAHWVEGAQYVRFRGIEAMPGTDLVIRCLPGRYRGLAVINGIQLVGTGKPPDDLPDALINLQFGCNSSTRKTGFGAFGKSAADIWNLYSRDGVNGFKDIGTLDSLLASDGRPTGASMIISNAAGSWGTEQSDEMFRTYNYSLDREDRAISVRINELPPGLYDLYLYGHGGKDLDSGNTVFTALASGERYGPSATAVGSGWTNANWIEGQQYVVLRNIRLSKAGDPLLVTASPGASAYSFLNGIQIRRKPPASIRQDRLIDIQFTSAGMPRKQGPAATGAAADDQWNLSAFGNGEDRLDGLVFANGAKAGVKLSVANAAGVWVNGMDDHMAGHYIYAHNGDIIYARLTGLEPGIYSFFLYGHGGPGLEKGNSIFWVAAGDRMHGPASTAAGPEWKCNRWIEGVGYALIRDVVVKNGQEPVMVKVLPGVAGSAFLSGMQIVYEQGLMTGK